MPDIKDWKIISTRRVWKFVKTWNDWNEGKSNINKKEIKKPENGRRRCKSKENGRNNPSNELLIDFSMNLKQFLHHFERLAIKDLSTCCGIRSWLLVRRLIGKTIRCLLSFSGLTTYYPRGISHRQCYVLWFSVKLVTSYESQRRRNLWSFPSGRYFDYLRPGEKDQWERKPTGNEFSVVELMRSRSRRNRGHYIRIMPVSSNFFLLEACCILYECKHSNTLCICNRFNADVFEKVTK